MTTIDVTYFTDPGCPWGYSALPALRVLGWRYGDQLRWRLVMIGLAEHRSQYEARGYTGVTSAQGQLGFRRYGVPFAPQAKPYASGTSEACRVIVAARIDQPGSEWPVLRALQVAQFTSPIVLDRVEDLRAVLSDVEGADRSALVDRIDDPDVRDAYERDRAETRTAAGTPGELQGKLADTDGAIRYTAPSLVFQRDGRRLEAAGFQPVEAYDVLVANLDPQLERAAPPATVVEVLDRFPAGLFTGEVAAVMTRGNDAPDPVAAERELIALAAAGRASRRQVGDDALWTISGG